MSDESDSDLPADDQQGQQGSSRAKPTKPLPTDRIVTEKQLSILRACAAASGTERKAVSNNDVADIVKVAATSVSLCNPFFQDIGLTYRDGVKFRPSDAVVRYSAAHEWDQEKSAEKLAPVFASSWFAKALVPRLSFAPLKREDALKVLAEESGASPDHRAKLETLIEFLVLSGVVRAVGSELHKAGRAQNPDESVDVGRSQNNLSAQLQHSPPAAPTPPPANRITIPIPGKQSAEIVFPPDLDADDWIMLRAMIETYIARLQKRSPSQDETSGE